MARIGWVEMMMVVLFLCTGNSCRSIMAEALFNHVMHPDWRAVSAGSHPAGFVHPKALERLTLAGIPVDGLMSKSWESLSDDPVTKRPFSPDLVITLCDSASGEVCPLGHSVSLRVHWGLADPAQVTGPPLALDAAFESAFRIIDGWIRAFFLLPLEYLKEDRYEFESRLVEISKLNIE